MSKLASEVTAAEWASKGPQTRAQRFFHGYASTVDSQGFREGTGLRFYAPSLVYHNQNNAVYYGGDQMWAWMKDLFDPFVKMEHDFFHVFEISRPDGSVTLDIQMTRKLWIKGQPYDEATPTVSIPVFWSCSIGLAETPEGFDGLQMKECWIYWDTALLEPFLSKDTVVFRKENPMV
jgi:hypothetical protein